MAKTQDELAESVLKKVGRLPDGQVAPESQNKTVTDAYSGLYDELLNDSLINWSLTDDIPEFAFYAVTILVCGMVANDFGVPDQWSGRREEMRGRLAAQLASPYVPQPTTFDNV